MAHLEPITYLQYIDKGKFSEVPVVVEEFTSLLYQPGLRWSSASEILMNPIYSMPGTNVALYRPDGNPNLPFQPVLHDMLSHGTVPVDWHRFIYALQLPEYLSEIRAFFEEQEGYIGTDTLTLWNLPATDNPANYPDANHYTWTHSPVADVRGSFDDFLGKLTKKRRGNLKTAMKQWEGYTVERFLPTDEDMFDFIIPNLYARHKIGASHAVRMFLIGLAAARKGYGDFFSVRDNFGHLICVYWYMLSLNKTVTYQGIVKDESTNTNNIGQATLGFAVKHYCERAAVEYLDPTCITQPFTEAISIDTYKRMVATTPAFHPTYLAIFRQEDMLDSFPPLFDGVKGRYITENKLVWSENRFPELWSPE